MAALPRKHYTQCAYIFLGLLLGSLLSWVFAIVSPVQINSHLRGREVPVRYKGAALNADGSIDLTTNITGSAPPMFNRYELTQYNRTVMPAMDVPSTGRPPVSRKTHYPLTLESPYVLNSPELCTGVDPLHVLVVVHTATKNFQRRRLIRGTWAGRNLMTTRTLRVVFALGLTRDATQQLMIENERDVYADIIQGAFLDSYHNLTHKGVLIYRWISEYCSHARLILKIDDDMFINPFLFYRDYYPKYSMAQRTIACHVRATVTSPILRGRGRKWPVDPFEFRNHKFYPYTYCNGYVVIITPDLIKGLFKAAYITPFFWVDDVYLYGMLPSHLHRVSKVTWVNIRGNFDLPTQHGLKCYRRRNCKILGTAARTTEAYNELWLTTLAHVSDDVRQQINPAYFVS